MISIAQPNHLIFLTAVLSVLSFSCAQSPADATLSGGNQPNIIFILADDLGWADVGFNGAKYYETPNLDRLAASGITFSNAYANAANCAPTRASILSGQYTPRHGILTVKASNRGDQKAQRLIPVPNQSVLDTGTFSMAEMLKTADYHTAFIGKWHIGNHLESSPLAHGFDYTLAGWERGSPQSYFSPYQNPALEDGPGGEYLTDRLTSEAMKYIQSRNASKDPFFLYLSYYAVHAPFEAKDSLIAKYRSKNPAVEGRDNPIYAAMIETLDANIGRLHQYLEEQGLMDNTILVFWSDNGGSFRATVNDPLKGAKGMPWEGGIRVPAFVYSPTIFPKAQSIDEPVISTDLYPTLAEWAGASLPDDYPLDGMSLAPLLKGRPLNERSLYWYAPVYLPGGEDYAFRMVPSAIIRKGDYKLIWEYGTNQTRLYNLKEDSGETRDLSLQQPGLKQKLLSELRDWHQATRAKVPTLTNPQFDQDYTKDRYESIGYE
ncbi:MAG: sulfatase [Phaeodactylibacter sp.]|uniref:sulfatase n=1 Tax=Phaeodactylibacter sp. TaxID=1940289 RepID=UPI0032ED0986